MHVSMHTQETYVPSVKMSNMCKHSFNLFTTRQTCIKLHLYHVAASMQSAMNTAWHWIQHHLYHSKCTRSSVNCCKETTKCSILFMNFAIHKATKCVQFSLQSICSV